ncbi:unnamed protein product [Acanthosepion pharaonis]|uniref:Uncharacterized protein n=1 Tax=Acanthosepion pharaonis TaxID=158019 RepID=A0A812ENX1_ACAPH|nr:unnamed protein product [Sepia pharaonis]
MPKENVGRSFRELSIHTPTHRTIFSRPSYIFSILLILFLSFICSFFLLSIFFFIIFFSSFFRSCFISFILFFTQCFAYFHSYVLSLLRLLFISFDFSFHHLSQLYFLITLIQPFFFPLFVRIFSVCSFLFPISLFSNSFFHLFIISFFLSIFFNLLVHLYLSFISFCIFFYYFLFSFLYSLQFLFPLILTFLSSSSFIF